MKLGEGGYGAVHKGILPNNSTVAVKQLFIKNTQGIDDFLNEVVLITGMKHRNLANLKGCCLREHQRLLVYLYVDNYDVDQVLLGYLAPEYASLGQLSEKVDVFSFGVVCLEVLSGRRNIGMTMPVDEIYLANWAWTLHGEGKLMDLVDQTLILRDDEMIEVQRLINITLLCCQDAAEQRPTMARVVAMLQHDSESEVVVLSSGKKVRQLDSGRLPSFVEEHTTVGEDEAETSSLYPRSSTQASSSGTVAGTLELSAMRGR